MAGMVRSVARPTPEPALPPDAGASPKRTRRSSGVNPRSAQIVDVAARLFAENGYPATSIQDIADGAGLLKGSLYYYFKSKQEILLEVARAAHNIDLEELLSSMDEVGSASEKVRRYIEYFVRNIASHPVTTAAFYRGMRYLEPDESTEIFDVRDRYEAALAEVIAAGQRDGSITAGPPAELLVIGILGLVNSIARWYEADGAWGEELIASTFADMVIDGMTLVPPR